MAVKCRQSNRKKQLSLKENTETEDLFDECSAPTSHATPVSRQVRKNSVTEQMR
jgi:hypothetical protein